MESAWTAGRRRQSGAADVRERDISTGHPPNRRFHFVFTADTRVSLGVGLGRGWRVVWASVTPIAIDKVSIDNRAFMQNLLVWFYWVLSMSTSNRIVRTFRILVGIRVGIR
jgi:hypothetical protein